MSSIANARIEYSAFELAILNAIENAFIITGKSANIDDIDFGYVLHQWAPRNKAALMSRRAKEVAKAVCELARIQGDFSDDQVIALYYVGVDVAKYCGYDYPVH